MTKQFQSVLSTDQLIQLAHQIFKKDSQDIRHIGALMRAHTTGSTPNWNRQELICFIAARNGGTDPDQIVRNIDAAAKRAVESKNQPGKGQQNGIAVRIIDLSKPPVTAAPENPDTLLRVPCFGGCGIKVNVTVGELKQYGETFCPMCLPEVQKAHDASTALLQKFLKEVPKYYPDPLGHNARIMSAAIERKNLANPTMEDLIEIYAENRSQLLGRLKPEDIRAMTSEQLAERERRDPGLGGVNIAACKAGQNRGEEINFSSNKSRLLPFQSDGSTSREGK